uniref:Uncharacterized protein n=1 Tax=Oryza brachyantha TaxID=4533 RepID=J3MG96_ORYBR
KKSFSGDVRRVGGRFFFPSSNSFLFFFLPLSDITAASVAVDLGSDPVACLCSHPSRWATRLERRKRRS